MRKGLSARGALNEAYEFISHHPSYRCPRLSRIIDQKGNTIGYEVRPLYMPSRFGRSDVLEVDYWLKDGKVKITIRIIPSIERAIPESITGSRTILNGICIRERYIIICQMSCLFRS